MTTKPRARKRTDLAAPGEPGRTSVGTPGTFAEEAVPEPLVSPTGGVTLCPQCRNYRATEQLDDAGICPLCRGVDPDPLATKADADRAAQEEEARAHDRPATRRRNTGGRRSK